MHANLNYTATNLLVVQPIFTHFYSGCHDWMSLNNDHIEVAILLKINLLN